MRKAKQTAVVDPLLIPEFLCRSKDAKTKAAEAKAWDAFMTKQQRLSGSRIEDAGKPVNWLKPMSMSEEEFERLTAQRDEVKVAKSRARIHKMLEKKIDRTGQRWDAWKAHWVPDAALAKAPTTVAAVKVKAASVAKKAPVAVTGILAEFVCRPDTHRATLLLTFEKSLGKMVKAEALSVAVYGVPDKVGPLMMSIKGATETIRKLSLPYEIKVTGKTEAWGLYKTKAKRAN